MPTNVYDVTQPPDTQLANLLGLDLRNLALNVQQRMALISGSLAGRWNPATDAQPANWTGLLYFATDTAQLFQWNGASWTDISAVFNNAASLKRYTDQTQYSFTVVGTSDTTGTVIPNGVLLSGSHVRIVCFGNSANAQTFRLKITTSFASTIIVASAALASGDFMFEGEFFASGTGTEGYYNIYINGALNQSSKAAVQPFPIPSGGGSTTVFTEYALAGAPLVNQYFLGTRVFV